LNTFADKELQPRSQEGEEAASVPASFNRVFRAPVDLKAQTFK
jgi:hypothetical protein